MVKSREVFASRVRDAERLIEVGLIGNKPGICFLEDRPAGQSIVIKDFSLEDSTEDIA